MKTEEKDAQARPFTFLTPISCGIYQDAEKRTTVRALSEREAVIELVIALQFSTHTDNRAKQRRLAEEYLEAQTGKADWQPEDFYLLEPRLDNSRGVYYVVRGLSPDSLDALITEAFAKHDSINVIRAVVRKLEESSTDRIVRRNALVIESAADSIEDARRKSKVESAHQKASRVRRPRASTVRTP